LCAFDFYAVDSATSWPLGHITHEYAVHLQLCCNLIYKYRNEITRRCGFCSVRIRAL